MKNIRLYIILSLIVFGCNKNKFDIDVSDIDINIKTVRLEKEMFDSNLDQIDQLIPDLMKKHGAFLSIYSKYIDDIHAVDDSLFSETFLYFITDYQYNQIYRKCIEVFPDVNELTDELTEAYKHINYYFPKEKTPEVYTCIIPTYKKIIIEDNYIGISIDKYLGSNQEYAKQGFYQYQINNMHKKKIVSDCILEWAKNRFPINDSITNLLDHMIYYGKIMYLVDAILPNENDSIKFGFTGEQIKFCEDNEAKMWGTLIEHKYLFVTDHISINKFIEEGPFTRDFHNKAPARSAIWLGQEIVRKYAKRNPNESLEELMRNNNTQQILNVSRYNP